MTKIAAITCTSLAAALAATAAQADNQQFQVHATSCSPYITGGCVDAASQEAGSVSVGGGYAFAGGYNGGYTLASASFAPGAATLLQAGLYQNSAIAHSVYSFQVQGAPNTLVPVHLNGLVSSAPIHLTDQNGQVVDLVDGSSDAPTPDWYAVASAYLQISPVRQTPYPISGAYISVEADYFGSTFGGAYCRNCDGGSTALDQTVWFWSNSDINVTLDASALLKYTSEGNSPLATFGSISAEVDPSFTIDDPAFSGFSIVGVPTGSPPPTAGAVPEPASWAMMLCGFGLIGGAMRRRGTANVHLQGN